MRPRLRQSINGMKNAVAFEREIELVEVRSSSSCKPYAVRIVVGLEEGPDSFSTVYESRKIAIEKSRVNSVINEKFSVFRAWKEQMIKVSVHYWFAEGQIGNASSYFFYEDLLNPRKALEIRNEESSFTLFVDLKNEVYPALKREASNPEAVTSEVELMQLIKTFSQFQERVTIFRRILRDFEAFVEQKNLRRDAKILGFLLLLVWFDFYFAVGLLIYGYVYDWPNRVRYGSLKFVRNFFERKEDSNETRSKNLSFVTMQQGQIISLIDGIQNMFMSDNRKDFYTLFYHKMYIKIGAMLLILYLSFKTNLTVLFLYKFLRKYWAETKEFLDVHPLKVFWSWVKPLGCAIAWVYRLATKEKPKATTLVKSMLWYQNQRKVFGQWKDNTLLFGGLIRKSESIRQKWRQGLDGRDHFGKRLAMDLKLAGRRHSGHRLRWMGIRNRFRRRLSQRSEAHGSCQKKGLEKSLRKSHFPLTRLLISTFFISKDLYLKFPPSAN